jgi:hypothetical protein
MTTSGTRLVDGGNDPGRLPQSVPGVSFSVTALVAVMGEI